MQSNQLNIAINGAQGRMGQEIIHLIKQYPAKYQLKLAKINSASLDDQMHSVYTNQFPSQVNFSVMIDFSTPAATIKAINWCMEQNIGLVIGTTGFDSEQLALIKQASLLIPIVFSPNMSLSVNLLFKLVGEVAKYLPSYEAEIIESHHRYKKDAPSGTALRLGQAIALARGVGFQENACFDRSGISEQIRPVNQIGFSVIRGGDIIGKHSVEFISDGEVLRLESEITNRQSFANGALLAAKFVAQINKTGLYSMSEVLFDGLINE